MDAEDLEAKERDSYRKPKPPLTKAERQALKEEKQAQKERNNGKTDAELAHEARVAAIKAEAAQRDEAHQSHKTGSLPWYVRARQEKRAARTPKDL